MKIKLTLLFFVSLFAHAAYAQCTGVKRIITKGPDGGIYINGKLTSGYGYPGFTVKPGDTLAFQAAADWNYIALENVYGTASCPVVLINYGGQVVLSGRATKFSLSNCRYIKLTGTGSSSHTYGFKAHNAENADLASDNEGVGFQVIGRSSNIYIEKVETRRKSYGMWIKQDPQCADSLNYPNWHMDNIKVFHCRFDSTGQDVIYAGNTSPTGNKWNPLNCNGTNTYPVPMRLSNIELAFLQMDYANRTGIQLSGCDSGYNSIHDCVITRMGYEKNEHQGTGISIGGMTANTHVYNNKINETYLYGLICFGVGTNYFYNNEIDSSGWIDGYANTISQPQGMFIDTRPTWHSEYGTSVNNQGPALDSSTVVVCSNVFGKNATTDGSDIYIERTHPIYKSSGSIIGNNRRKDGSTIVIKITKPPFNYSTTCPDFITPSDAFAIPGKLEAENWTAMSGVQKEPTLDAGGGENVGYIDYGDWIDYNVDAQTPGAYTIQFRVASPNNGAQFQVKNDAGELLATINVPNTGGWQNWQTVSSTFSLPAGEQTLRLVSSGSAWNINWLDFVFSSVTRIEGEAWTNMLGAQNEPTSDVGGGYNVGYIDPNDWVEYNISASAAGTYDLTLRLATHFSGAQMNILRNGTIIAGPVNLPHTGGWQSWQNFTIPVELAAGPQTIRFVSLNTSGWNLNWWEFTPAGSGGSRIAGNNNTMEETQRAVTRPAFVIYPNPVRDQLMLKLEHQYAGNVKVTVTNIMGAVVKEFTLRKQAAVSQHPLLLGDLVRGQYHLTIQMGDVRLTQKIIKQ
jgi:hypothetical protein